MHGFTVVSEDSSRQSLLKSLDCSPNQTEGG
ncbi:hypothetical protein Goshw_009234 [Gossypium schwendimanii]|uniref:Uncharacterized protein n=1 Tax=Gossypium schwendimanii TaxID=34291 RepID=A0A7J9NC19_GOSSC|nr:hypothetical protein [Gossypium schwendimanii]